MGKIPNLFQIQEACYPLHRVKGSEDDIDILLVSRVLLQIQYIHFDFVDIFETFDDEIPEQ